MEAPSVSRRNSRPRPLELLWQQNNRTATVALISSLIVLAIMAGLLTYSCLKPQENSLVKMCAFFFLAIAVILFQIRARAAACASSCAAALHYEAINPQTAQEFISKSDCLKNSDKFLAAPLGLFVRKIL
jgi:hypothetical protein